MNASRVKPDDRFHENCAKVREAGYNVKPGGATRSAVVFVNGCAVHRGLFETLHWATLLPLIDMKIGLGAAHACAKAV